MCLDKKYNKVADFFFEFTVYRPFVKLSEKTNVVIYIYNSLNVKTYAKNI